jgi:hypothetical protein
MKLPHRRHILHLTAGVAALPAVSRVVWAQAYPSRPVRTKTRIRARAASRCIQSTETLRFMLATNSVGNDAQCGFARMPRMRLCSSRDAK